MTKSIMGPNAPKQETRVRSFSDLLNAFRSILFVNGLDQQTNSTKDLISG